MIAHSDPMTLTPERVRQILRTPKPCEAQPKRPETKRRNNLGKWLKMKLTDWQRRKLRKRLADGERQWVLAQEFGVSQAYVSMIANGKR